MSQVLSHAMDTVSAHDAAEYMEKSGKATLHRAKVIRAVAEKQGLTAAEIGELTGLGHVEAQRRISDLKNDGVVRYGQRRKCTTKPSNMSTVYLTQYGCDLMQVTPVIRG